MQTTKKWAAAGLLTSVIALAGCEAPEGDGMQGGGAQGDGMQGGGAQGDGMQGGGMQQDQGTGGY